jgi:hypothetical protein
MRHLDRILPSTIALTCLVLCAPAWAVTTVLEIPGDVPSVSGGTLTFPGQPTVEIKKSEDCDRDKQNDCPATGLFYIDTKTALATGSKGKISLDTASGKYTGAATVSPDGKIGVTGLTLAVGMGSHTSPFAILRGGYLSQRNPADNGGIGTDVTAGGELKLAIAPRNLTGYTVNPSAFFPLGNKAKIEASGYYNDVSGNASQSVPVAGDNVAITYARDVPTVSNPQGFSTGLGLGATGADATTRIDDKSWGFSLKFKKHFDQSFGSVTPFIGLAYRYGKEDIVSSFTSQTPGFSGIFSDYATRVSYRDFAVPLGVQFGFNLDSMGTFQALLGAEAVPSYRRSRLRGLQATSCDLCAADLQNVTLNLAQNDHGFELGGAVDAGLMFSVADNVSIGGYGRYFLFGNVPNLNVRDNPNDANTGIGSGTQRGWTAGGMLEVGF